MSVRFYGGSNEFRGFAKSFNGAPEKEVSKVKQGSW